jgi:HAD superfamily hydrolase (TIGR01549 family)
MTSAPSPVRAVIFDLDGTLVDSMPLVLRAFAHALAPYRPDLDERAIFQRLGGPPARMMAELIGDEAKAAEALRRLDAFGFDNGALVEAFGGMKSLLETLHARGLLLAIWTGRDRRGTEAILAAHGIAAFFKTVVCGDDLDTHKPHPGGLVEILARLGLRPGEALYAGDADADVLGGNEAGVRTLLITHGREVDPLIEDRAWCRVDTPEQAYTLLRDKVVNG